MARLPRLAIAGHPHHVLQRGNNGQAIFVDDQDRGEFLRILADEASRAQVAVHAYVLLDDHFHLLATPLGDRSLPAWMQGLGRRYVRHFNDRHGRSGTLWNGRYRATLVQAETHLVAAMVYIDLHPVRAGQVTDPGEYRWSSHAHYAGRRIEPWLTVPEAVWRLANTPFAREAAYRQRVEEGLRTDEVVELTRSVRQAWVLGDAAFVAQLQRDSTRRLSPARRGRPVGTRRVS